MQQGGFAAPAAAGIGSPSRVNSGGSVNLFQQATSTPQFGAQVSAPAFGGFGAAAPTQAAFGGAAATAWGVASPAPSPASAWGAPSATGWGAAAGAFGGLGLSTPQNAGFGNQQASMLRAPPPPGQMQAFGGRVQQKESDDD